MRRFAPDIFNSRRASGWQNRTQRIGNPFDIKFESRELANTAPSTSRAGKKVRIDEYAAAFATAKASSSNARRNESFTTPRKCHISGTGELAVSLNPRRPEFFAKTPGTCRRVTFIEMCFWTGRVTSRLNEVWGQMDSPSAENAAATSPAQENSTPCNLLRIWPIAA